MYIFQGILTYLRALNTEIKQGFKLGKSTSNKFGYLCGSSTGEDPLFWEISIFQYINRKKWKIFEILTNWKFWSKTALPAFLQKLYIYSIMSARLTLAISNFFSKKNTWKYFCSNILHIIYIIFFDFFLRWKTCRVKLKYSPIAIAKHI